MTGRVAAVLGLGLIGGSVARELAAHGVRVLGHDADDATLRRAIDDGVVAAAVEPDFINLGLADWVVLAVPVDRAPALLQQVAPHVRRARLITDVGSTKRSVLAAAARLQLGATFVGSHPLAGDHASGWAASRSGLFEDARVFLCPAAAATRDALEEANALWAMCGARPEVIDADRHDALLARTSHLPQLLSTALAATLATERVPFAETGPGARGMLRLAGSSTEMWGAIVADNADNIEDVLGVLEATIRELRAAVGRGDAAAVRAVLENGRSWASG